MYRINNTNTNLSFQAKLKTNIVNLESVGNIFKKISRGEKGTLSIYHNKNGEIFATDGISKVNVEEIITKYYLISRPTTQDKAKIANRALNTLRLLQAESSYNKAVEEIKTNNTDLARLAFNRTYSSYQRLLKQFAGNTLAPTIFKDLRNAI